MIIHVVRHAEAVDRSDDIPEEHRFLTRRGRKKFRKIAKSFRKSGATPGIMVTSPLVRAVQTADILAEALRYKGELLLAQPLAHDFGLESLDRLLDQHPDAQEIVLVGHEPDVGGLARALLDQDVTCALQKGDILSVDRPAAGGKAAFIQLVTGAGKVVTSRKKAAARLTTEQQ